MARMCGVPANLIISTNFTMARMCGVPANLIISTAFAISGLLAGVVAMLWIGRIGAVVPGIGLEPLLIAFIATVIGGMRSLQGAVLGGFLLGLAEVLLRSWLPEDIVGLTDAVVFGLIALFFIFRPGGLVTVATAERV
jgi:branched-chain amino acid transport system permease protein